ncbi:hypothetical protein NM688_g8852 [Phlebia brevispora]|uniref:Uncharacterized protein n=1 Tax=Phlebia brevispora TaxID=194682 RepID=A0ACC1RNM4_9APHY|nr:hypothetical protein NM688_g8852 [Phlebia brevispora]
MYSPPIGAVSKPSSTDLRLVTDHSAGSHAPNSWIPREDTHVRLDNLHDLGEHLLQLRRELGRDAFMLLWKSDVSLTYRHLPMHPLWQLKQIVTIDGERHVDHCLVFGCRASAIIWCLFFSLVLWIAVHIKGIPHLLVYMDDSFTAEASPALEFYEKYHKLLSRHQVILLRLWDELGILHRAPKQLHGTSLPIIGFQVDCHSMSFTLPSDRKAALLNAIHAFLDAPDRRRSLREWQRMLGWCNWALNVAPLLRPALQSSYAKIAGVSRPHTRIFINQAVQRDLSWFTEAFENFDGRFFPRRIPLI